MLTSLTSIARAAAAIGGLAAGQTQGVGEIGAAITRLAALNARLIALAETNPRHAGIPVALREARNVFDELCRSLGISGSIQYVPTPDPGKHEGRLKIILPGTPWNENHPLIFERH